MSSKYALVIYAAKRARQINDYYNQLGDGILEYVGPLVEPGLQEKARCRSRSARSTPTCSSIPKASSQQTRARTDGTNGSSSASPAESPPTRRLRGSRNSARRARRPLSDQSALHFVGAATFEALSGHPVRTGVFEEVPEVPPRAIGQEADLVVVAPATADLLARARHRSGRRSI